MKVIYIATPMLARAQAIEIFDTAVDELPENTVFSAWAEEDEVLAELGEVVGMEVDDDFPVEYFCDVYAVIAAETLDELKRKIYSED